MRRYRFSHPTLPCVLTYEAKDAREAKRMVEDDIQQLRLPGWSAKWAPLEVKPTSRDIRSWSFLLIEPSGQRQFSPGQLTYVGQVTEPEPGPMDTHLAADDLLETLLNLRAKLN